jgi:hypothetical protein
MKVAATICLLVFGIVPAFAGESAVSLTMSECLSIHAGLNALDQYTVVVKENGQEKSISKQYKLGNARMTVALDMSALKSVADAAEKARTGLITEIGQGKDIKIGTPEGKKFTDQMQQWLDSPCSVKPGHIKLADLKIGDGDGENPIPPSVISALLPILDQ